MKKNICVFLLAIFVLIGCENNEDSVKATYKIINSEYDFKTVTMFDDFGYALDRENRVLYTEDKGKKFCLIELKYPEYIDMENSNVSVCFNNKNEFYIVCGKYDSSTLYVCKAGLNGIEEITEIQVPYGAQQGNLCMINQEEGYLIYNCLMGGSSYYTEIYYSNDGCKSFNLYAKCNGISAPIRDFKIFENGETYVSTEISNGIDVYKCDISVLKDVYYYKLIKTDINTDNRNFQGIIPIFTDDDFLEAYLILYEEDNKFFKQKIYVTEDGGESWERLESLTDKIVRESWGEIYLTQDMYGELWFINCFGDLCKMIVEK